VVVRKTFFSTTGTCQRLRSSKKRGIANAAEGEEGTGAYLAEILCIRTRPERTEAKQPGLRIKDCERVSTSGLNDWPLNFLETIEYRRAGKLQWARAADLLGQPFFLELREPSSMTMSKSRASCRC